MRRRDAATAGFATVDILVAVTVVVLIGALAMVTFGNLDRRRLANESAEVALFLQEARMRALESGRPVELRLSARDSRLDAGSRVHRFPDAVAVAPPEARVILQPSGSSEGLALVMTRNDERAQVTLDWLTGRVTIQ